MPHFLQFFNIMFAQIDQLFRIFEKLGTPSASLWPDLVRMPDWCDKFPKFRQQVRWHCCPH